MNIPADNRLALSDYSRRVYFSFESRFFHQPGVIKSIEVCRVLDGGRVLEIGCHDMLFYYLLKKKYKQYIGIDLDLEKSLILARNNKQNLAWDDVKIVGGRAESLPFEDESFDLVFCFETIEHLVDEAKGISEMVRVLKSGGILVVSVPIEFGLMLLMKALARFLLPKLRNYQVEERYALSELMRGIFLCNLDNMERVAHKGYDYRKSVKYLHSQGMKIQRLYRFPLNWLPDFFSGGLLIVLSKGGKSKTMRKQC